MHCDDLVLSTNSVVIGDALDRDSDGIPDWWEATYGMNSMSGADAGLDDDLDGVSNADEYWAGTLPNDSGSIFAVNFMAPLESGLILRWSSVSNQIYAIGESTNLVTGGWNSVVTNLTATPPQNSYTGAPPAAANQRFYRISTQRAK